MHLRDMADLHKAHPDVYRKFKSGHFTVQKTKRVFSAIPIDQAHEQNNARMVVQLASQIIQMFLNRWMIAGPEIARVIEEFEHSYLENNGEMDTHHHDQTASIQTSFAKIFALW